MKEFLRLKHIDNGRMECGFLIRTSFWAAKTGCLLCFGLFSREPAT
jgi:hypothetical protein